MGREGGPCCHGDASPAEANLCWPLVGSDCMRVCVCVFEGEKGLAVYIQTCPTRAADWSDGVVKLGRVGTENTVMSDLMLFV